MEEEQIEDKLIEERKKKAIAFLKKEYVYISIALLALVILGVYIRSLPMQDHGGRPGLWDITTNTWTLGPDLDPWLFTRYAKTMIETGHLPHLDTMRNVPLGFDITTELQMVSYMIVWTYGLVNIFGNYDIMFAAVFMPVLLFALTILSFFFFVKELFAKKGEHNLEANIIAFFSTLFMIVIPVFLPRTIAGIPEKESVAFFFMFLSFFLFLKAWKAEKLWMAVAFGILSGISTALMGLTWGGVIYVYVVIASSNLAAFFINKYDIKKAAIYLSWIITALFVTFMSTNRFSFIGFSTSLDTGLSLAVTLIICIDLILWETKLKNKLEKLEIVKQERVPRQIISILIAIFAGFIIMIIIFGPSIILQKINDLNQVMFRPVVGRWSTTVAENRQPYFWEWASSLGPFIGRFPVLFWLALIGMVTIFNTMLNKFYKKDRIVFLLLFCFFISGMVFSRYSSQSILNGENLISKAFYYLSILAFFAGGIYFIFKYKKEKNDLFLEVPFERMFILIFMILCIFTARSAVRLVMTLGPIAPIFAVYLAVHLVKKLKRENEEFSRFIVKICIWGAIILLFYCFFGVPFNNNYPGFYKQATSQAYSSIPYYYNFQWQNAMSWVRNNTLKNAVFAHWWDYGYWLQSIGDRATVTDGGNAIVWWNYLSGRYVLTGNNQNDALEFLYNHNTTHLLIDSSDLGKYGAFSSIGSDENMDRFSSGPALFISNDGMVQEKTDSIARIYQLPSGGGAYIEEDIIYDNNGTKIQILTQNSGVIGIMIEMQNKNNSISFKQPEAVFASQGKQVKIPLRYLKYGDKFYDFKIGLNATAYIIPKVNTNSIDPLGAIMYISPRLMKGMLARIYILNDPFNNFNGFKLVHTEPNLLIESIRQQTSNFDLGDFVYYNDIQGPIKIWEVHYTGSEKIKKEYIDIDASKYLSWKL
jgi:asparagine N-glycosylation enzyme membrane subunit Stt3